MKHIKFGNLVDEVNQGIIVHGCNAQGAMNSGIAKEIRAKYPENYEVYHNYCKELGPRVALGTVCWFSPYPGLLIANAITQLNYGRDPHTQYVDYEAVQKCFISIDKYIRSAETPFRCENIHYPTIGAGLGNGDWAIINDIIDLALITHERTLWLLPKTY